MGVMAQWKPVSIPVDNTLTSDDFGGLIGVEELILTEENGLLKSTFPSSSSKFSKKPKKRKGKIKKNRPSIKISKNKLNTLKDKVIPKLEKSTDFLKHMRSWSSFGIHNEILYALYEKNFFEPTKIQSMCLNPAIHGRLDILGAAETGSGKTLAFGIPIINGILSLKNETCNDNEENNVDEEDWENSDSNFGCVKVTNLKFPKEKNKLLALILTPTRELAVQVKDHLIDICKYTDIKIALVVGGLAQEKQERILNKRPEIIVATPGRLWELINDKNIHLQDISKIRYFVIDETDRMLEKGHFAELTQLLERINFNEKEKKRRQNFVFSATLTVVHEPPSYLKRKRRKRITPGQKLQTLIDRIGITNPKIIDITSSQITAENLYEYKIFCKFEEKDYYLYHFLKTQKGRIIVFCNSIGCVKRLANLLSIVSLKPLPLHANMEQKQRLKNLEKFRSDENGLLLATDVAARGLDIPNVNHVVHYQVPKTAETYVHRSGRTARADNSGTALLLIEPHGNNTYNNLIRTLGRDKEIEDFTVNVQTFNHTKKIIHLARDIDQLSLALRKENSKASWYEKAIKDLDIVIDEHELPKKRSFEADVKIKKDLNFKKKELKELLEKPHLPQKGSGKFPDMNFQYNCPMADVRRDKLKIPGAFVLRNVPFVT